MKNLIVFLFCFLFLIPPLSVKGGASDNIIVQDLDYSKDVFKHLKYFTCAEFNSHDVKKGCERMDWEFLYLLDEARERAGVPFIVSSGFRTEKRNAAVGGVFDSCHLYGYCADIKVVNGHQRFLIVKAALEVGFTRIGVYQNHIHLSNDPAKIREVLWVGKYNKL